MGSMFLWAFGTDYKLFLKESSHRSNILQNKGLVDFQLTI